MSEVLTIPYTTPSNYLYDTDEIEIIAGIAKLKLQQDNANFTEDFADDTDFTYESSKAFFSGGKVQQKDQRPANATCGATYTADINLNWGNGVLTGTATGGATVSGGNLNLKGGTLKFVEYAGLDNASALIQIGCAAIEIIPNYSGTPVSNRSLFYIAKNDASFTNRIQILHASTGGNLYLYVFDSSGVAIIYAIMGAWNPVAGTPYLFLLNFDVTTGSTSLKINGVQLGATLTQTGTRSNSIGRITIGSDYARTSIADFEIRYFELFSTNQASINPVSEYIYAANNVILPEMEHTLAGTIKVFNSFVTTEGGAPRYTLQIGRSGNYLYWNGSAWVTSNNTYAQANTKTTFNANCASLPVDGENYGQFKILFTDSNTQSYVDNLIANMNIDIGYLTTNPKLICNTSFLASEILEFLETTTKPANTEIKYTVSVNNIEKYITGGVLTTSNGTYSQANTASEIETNIALFLDTRSTVKLNAFFHTSDDQATPELDTNIITYDSALPDPSLSTLVELEGFIYLANGPAPDVDIYVRPYLQGRINSGVFEYYEWVKIGTTSATGWVEGNIYRQPSQKYWEIKIGNQNYKIELPDQATVDISTLEIELIEVVE